VSKPGRGGARGRGARGRGRGGAAAGGGRGGSSRAEAPAAAGAPTGEAKIEMMSKVPDYIRKRYEAGADGKLPEDPMAEFLEKPTKALHNMTDIPEFAEGQDDGRIECEYCSRKFNRGRIAKH